MTKFYFRTLLLFACMLICLSLLNAPTAHAQNNNTARLHNEQAVKLYNAGRYSEAEPHARRALAAEEQRSGRNSQEITPLLENLAAIYRKQSRHEEAAPLLRRAYEIATNFLSSDHPDVGSLLLSMALNFKSMSKSPPEAEEYFKLLLTFEESANGPTHKKIAFPILMLVGFYKEHKRLAEVEALAKRALDVFPSDDYPDDRPLLSALLAPLIEYYLVEKRFSEAEPFARRALLIEENESGKDHVDVAIILNFLGVSEYGLGRFQDATASHSRALRIREAAISVNAIDVATSLNNLAAAYQAQGLYRDAELALVKALTIMRDSRHADSKLVSMILLKLGSAQFELDKHDDAERSFKEVIVARENASGINDRVALEGRNNLGCLYRKVGRGSEAVKIAKDGLELAEKAFGANDELVGTFANCLALSYADAGRYDEARSLYGRALAVIAKNAGEHHPNYATLLNNLAGTYLSQDRFEEAEKHYRLALSARERLLGADHALVGETLNNIMAVYIQSERYSDAAQLGMRALAIVESGRGTTNSVAGILQYNIGVLFERQSNFLEAERFYRRALSIAQTVFGTTHITTARRLGALGELLKSEGKLDQAAPFLTEALEIAKVTLGSDSSESLRAMVQLAELYVLVGRLKEADSLFREAGSTNSTDLREFPIYFGTNRKPISPGSSYFGSERNGINLTYGTVRIVVSGSPNTSQRVGAFQTREVPTLGRLSIKNRSVEERVDLVRSARARLLNSRRYLGQALVFVHGFNVSFDNAARRAAQLAYDLDFDGPIFLFSWPSRGSVSPFAYIDDRETAQVSAEAMRVFLEHLVAPTNSTRIHTVAHSMGNVTLNEALQGMDAVTLEKFKFGEMVLASPDLDVDLFQRTFDKLRVQGARSTIYGSRTDRALAVAGWARSRNPLGYIPANGPDRIVAGSDLIDVSNANTEVFSLNHDIYATSTDIMRDIKALLLTQQRPPDMRTKELKKLKVEAGTYWRFEK